RFVEGTLADPERAAIVQHIADCDDCRILVVDAAEFIEPAKTESHKWWMGVAAAAVLVAVIGPVGYQHFHPLGQLEKAYGQLNNRPLETRLSDSVYVARKTMRGAGDDEIDTSAMLVASRAGDI